MLIDSYSFLGKYDSEYEDAFNDALESEIEYFSEECSYLQLEIGELLLT